jgi:hypothetical protein
MRANTRSKGYIMKRILIVTALLLANTVAQAQNYRDVWDDVRKPWRSNAEMDFAVQADASACDAEVGDQYGGPSRAYIRCMRRHDWKLRRVERLPRSYAQPEPDSNPIPQDNFTPPPITPPDMPPPAPYEPPPQVDIHPFCPNPIC